MSEYTKGKWLVSSTFLVVNEQAKVIANLIPLVEIEELRIPTLEAEANANRICLCVNSHNALLDACEEALTNLEYCDSSHEQDHKDSKVVYDCIELLMQAIAQAKE